MSNLYVVSAMMHRAVGGEDTFTHISGYRVADNGDQAKGDFVSKCFEERPGFAIAQLLCMEVPFKAIELVYEPSATEAS